MGAKSVYSYINDGKNLYDAAGVTGSYIDSDFPLANAFDGSPGKVTKATGETMSIYFDFGAAVDLSLIALINHNITEGDINTAVLMYDDNAPTPPADLPSPSGYVYLDAHGEYDKSGLFQAFTSANARYWQLKISLVDNVPEIGEIWLGNQNELLRPDFSFIPEQSGSYYRTQTEGGNMREKQRFVSRSLNLGWNLLMETEKPDIDTFLNNVKFNKKAPLPFIYINNPDVYYAPDENLHCRISDSKMYKKETKVKYKMATPLTLYEVPFDRGDD